MKLIAKLFIIFAIITCATRVSNSQRVRERLDKDIKRIIFVVDVNCKDLKSILNSPSTTSHDRSYIRDLIWECYQLVDKLDEHLKALDSCLVKQPRLKKRAIPWPVVVKGIEILGTGITTFITAKFIEGQSDTSTAALQMPSTLNHASTMRLLADSTEMQEFNVADIKIVSESGPNHERQVREISKLAPKVTWAGHYLESELLAGYANLDTIAEFCQRGKLAVPEVAELSGNLDLTAIESEQTELISIQIDLERKSVDITFKILPLSHIDTFVYYCIAGAMSIYIVAVVALMSHCLKSSVSVEANDNVMSWAA